MAIMLKIRWDIKKGREQEFRENQKKLCAVMSGDHPGVICYHVDYPASGVSEWTEIYANNSVFKAHLDNLKGRGAGHDYYRSVRQNNLQVFGEIPTTSRSRSSPVSGRPTTTPQKRRFR